MIFSFFYIRYVWESPLSNADPAIHKNERKFISIFQPEGELMIQDGINSVLQTNGRNFGRLNSIAESSVFGKTRIH